MDAIHVIQKINVILVEMDLKIQMLAYITLIINYANVHLALSII